MLAAGFTFVKSRSAGWLEADEPEVSGPPQAARASALAPAPLRAKK
jgi:hypothetical protein